MLKKSEFGNPLLDGVPTKNDVLIILGMAIKAAEDGYGCNECTYRTNECDLEYSSQDWPSCTHPESMIQNRQNLKSFPFKNAPNDCFLIERMCSSLMIIDPWFICSPDVGHMDQCVSHR